MTLFRVDASIFPPAMSASHALGDIVESGWTAAHPSDDVVRVDLTADPVESREWTAAVTAGQLPEEHLTDAHRSATARATAVADTLIDADALLFDVPLYNFGVSQHFKTWFDLVYTDPRLSEQTSQLRGKPAVLVTTLGGNYSDGTPKAGWDHSTAWIRRVLESVWGLDLTIVQRQFTLVGVNPALDQFAEMGAALKTAAEADAHSAGQRIVDAAAALREDVAA